MIAFRFLLALAVLSIVNFGTMPVCRAEGGPKILINIVAQSALPAGTAQSRVAAADAQSGAATRAIETLLAKTLLKSGREVVTSDEFVTDERIDSGDLAAAREGNLNQLRKVAAFYNAPYVLNGFARAALSEEEVLGIQMQKVVAVLAYKLIRTATGKILDIDNVRFIGASRSPETAVQTAVEKLADSLGPKLNARLDPPSTTQLRALQQYRAKFYKPPATQIAVADAPAAPQPTAVTESLPSAAAASKQAPVDKDAQPQIVIINPPLKRGFKTVIENRKRLDLEGLVIDKQGIERVTVNGHDTALDAKGRFTHDLKLNPGDNEVLVVALNKRGGKTTKRIIFNRPPDKSPPEIQLIKPQINRGFAVVKKTPKKKITVEGKVKDESEILFVRINGRDASIGDDGVFSDQLTVPKEETSILIEAADSEGNLSRKSFQLATEYTGTRDLSSSKIARGTPAVGLKPTFWGLSIGVSRYQSEVMDLKFADRDALVLAEFFKNQPAQLFGEVQFKTLINEQVTRESVINNITTYLGQAAPDDVVFIFLAGHGVKHRQSGSYCFLPADADAENLLSKGLRMSDFEEAVKILSKNVNKVVLAMDTCHSGAMTIGTRAAAGGEDLVEALKAASGYYVLAAAKAGEESIEHGEFSLGGDSGHGAFTYALVKGMRGDANYDDDAYISLTEVFQYVAKQVPRLTNGRQHPYFRSQGTDLPLIAVQ